VLIDSTPPEFPLGNVRDPRQLFVIGNSVPSPGFFACQVSKDKKRLDFDYPRNL